MITSEQAMIAAILLDEREFRTCVTECIPLDFEDKRVGMIFAGMAAMFREREPIDVITVSDHLLEWDVRGITAIDFHSWTSEVSSSAHAGTYARQVRKGAMQRGLQEVATRLSNEKDVDPGIALAKAQERLKTLRDGHVQTSLEARTLGTVLLDDNDEYDWVVEDLLERNDRVLLTGTEGAGKSTLVRQMAILAAAGVHPFTFFPTKPAKVLVVDAENTERQWRRAVRPLVTKAALRGRVNPADTVSLACTPRIDLSKDSDLGEVHRMIDEVHPDILFIGPLYRLTPRAINDDDDAMPILAALDTLRERGCAMVIEAHAGHAKSGGAVGERDLRPRGSAALMGWPEFGLGLRPDKSANASNRFQLIRWRGDRDARAWPTQISRGSSDWPWTPTTNFQGRQY
ncbi:AAA family ATPase [Subtercola sp. YIM 133946]|uniref:AAA family ATPase n=1 Tax=Subtercola sp. YIM 133946 TaxID=3118909 RepID=UPI002F944D70